MQYGILLLKILLSVVGVFFCATFKAFFMNAQIPLCG